jgi:DNA-binding NtrC family response regulator
MATILLVDDDIRLRGRLAGFLESKGYETKVAQNGEKALAILEGFEIDLVVTDLNMPEMDGMALLSELLETRPTLPVVAMSGGGLIVKEELLLDASLMGAVEILSKPFPLQGLAEVIERRVGPSP